MSQPANHPPQSELLEFGLGKLPPDDSQRIEQHLEACPDCSQTVLVLQDDTFVGLVRTSKGKAPATVNADATVDVGVGATTRYNAAAQLPAELRNHSRYEILGLIGRGGMGDVYQAQHRVMNRLVALKVIKPELVQNEAAVQRFRREVQAAARLHDRNIVTAYDAEQAGSLHFLVMEYVEGVNLDEVVRRRGSLPVAEACDAIRQAACGLQHAHELGMVHRDIKPHNLMLTPAGDVKILDFGLAGIASELHAEESPQAENTTITRTTNHQLTQAGSMMGTPDYIAPEQATDAHAADIRADIYSLGCTFYTLLAGRPPFDPGSVFDKIKAHAEQTPRLLAEYRADVPAEVEAILLKMLAKNAADRYQTPQQVIAALEQAAPAVAPKPLPAVVRQKQSRARLVALAMIASFLAIMAAVVFYIQTNTGVVRVEVADASLEVKLNGQTIEMKDGTVPLTIRAGAQQLIVRRGNFEFRTDNFELRRGDAVALKIELLAGEVVVLKDGQRFGAQPLPAEQRLIPSIADGGPSALGLLLRDRSRNLRHIGAALLDYQKKHGSFPPTAKQQEAFDATGRPHLSWRVHLLPFLGQQKLFDKFRLNEPWDSAHNKPLLAEMPDAYKPSADPTRTQLLAVVGKGTAYEGQAGLKLSDFHDGTSFTAYVVDAGPAKAVPWTKPEDLPFDSEDPIRAFGRSDWGDEFLYLMTDCTVRAIHYDTAPESLRALFTRAAGDKFEHWAKRTTPLPIPGNATVKIENLLTDAVLALDFAQADFYEMNGKSRIRDLSGKGNDLLCEDAGFSAEGPNRSSVSIGAKGSLSLPRRLIASGQPFTVAAWVHRKLPWDQGDPLVFAQRNKDGTHELSCGLGIVDAVWNLNFASSEAYIHHPFDEDVEKSRRFARLGNWGFVAWTRDATGKLSFTTESLTQRTTHMDSGVGEEDDHEQVDIGRGLDGSLDGLVVFNRALSSLELAALCDHVDAGRKLVPVPGRQNMEPLTIGMNDEFGMLFEGRLVAPAELSRRLDEALKENPEREVVIDLPKRPWTVAPHVDQLEQIARIAGAKRITRPAWAIQPDQYMIKPIGTLPGDGDNMEDLLYLPDGKQLVSGGSSKQLVIWDVASRQRVKTLPWDQVIRCILLLPDGRIVTGGWQGTIRIWNLEEPEKSTDLAGHSEVITALTVAPDGKRLFSGSTASIRLWDLESGKEIAKDSTDCRGAAFLNNGVQIVHLSRNQVVIRDTQSFEIVRTLAEIGQQQQRNLQRLAISDDEKMLAFGDSAVFCIDLVSGKEVGQFPVKDGMMQRELAFIPGTHLLISGDDSPALRLIDVDAGKVLTTLVPKSHSAWALAVSPDGRQLASAGGSWKSRAGWQDDPDKSIYLWQLPQSVWPK